MKRPRLSTKELDGVMNAYLVQRLGGTYDGSACADDLLSKYAHQIYCDLHLLRLCYPAVARSHHTPAEALEAAMEVVSETLTQYSSSTQLNLASFCVRQWPTEHLLELCMRTGTQE